MLYDCCCIRSVWIHHVLIIGCNCEMNENFKVYATQKMRMNQLRLRLNTQQQPKYFVYVNEIFSQDTLYLSLSVDFALKKIVCNQKTMVGSIV